ncbi:MAG: hypothetical protein QM831_06050 [Kofleriaceae bacterium]
MRAWIFACLVACTGSAPGDQNHPSDSAAGSADAPASQSIDAPAGRDLSTDRTKFFGASRCADANVMLCEDFESGTLDTGTWQTVGTAPVIDTVQAARGTHALHVHLNANGASYIKETKTFPALKGNYYGRAFVYFAHLPVVSGAFTYSHWTILASTTSIGEIRISGQMQNGKNLFGVGTDSGNNMAGTGDWTNSDADPNNQPRAVPTGEWECLEWQHDSTNNVTHVWWDDVAHPSLDTTASDHGGNTNPYDIPDITAAWFGWQEYQTSTEEFEMWVDEIAVDKDRIGCVI